MSTHICRGPYAWLAHGGDEIGAGEQQHAYLLGLTCEV